MIDRPRIVVDLCALLAGRRLAPATSWEAVADLAEAHLVGPALWERVRAQPGVPAGEVRRLQGAFATNLIARDRLRAQLVDAVGALNAAGIEPLVFKGGLGLLDGSGSQSAVMADLDLVAPGADFAPALEALTAIGYDVNPGPGAAAAWQSTAVRSGAPGPIDLHRWLVPADLAALLPEEAVMVRAVSAESGGVRYRAPAPVDQLVHAVLHSQVIDLAHRTAAIPVRRLHTFAGLYARHRAAWPEAAARLTSRRRVLAGHAALVERLWGVEVRPPGTTAAGRLHTLRCLATAAVPHAADIHANAVWSLQGRRRPSLRRALTPRNR